MPLQCCISKCSKEKEKGLHLFHFPSDERLRQKWLEKIPTKIKVAGHTRICEKHFLKRFLHKSEVCELGGQVQIVPRKRWSLNKRAVPTIFPSHPEANWSIPENELPPDPEEVNRQVQMQVQLDRLQIEQQKIKTLSDIMENPHKYQLRKNWFLTFEGGKVHIFKVDYSSMPCIEKSFSIDENLQVEAFVNGKPFKLVWIKHILGVELKCDLFRRLDNLIEFFDTYQLITNAFAVDRKPDVIKSEMDQLLNKLISLDESKSKTLTFLIDQLKNTILSMPRYSSEHTIFLALFYHTHPNAYNYLRSTNLFKFPGANLFGRTLGNILSGPTKDFLKPKLQKFPGGHVNLIMDEVYIRSKGSKKSSDSEGQSNTSSSTDDDLPMKLQIYTLGSITSDARELVGIYPVKKSDTDLIYTVTGMYLKQLHDIGFKVISIISENLEEHQKLFQQLSSSNELLLFIDSPGVVQRKMFFFFDTGRILKSIRDDWFNKDNGEILIPKFDNPSQTMAVKFSDLEKVFELEKTTGLGLSSTLEMNILFPFNRDKHKLSFAESIFNEKNIRALQRLQEQTKVDCSGTIQYLSIIQNWWLTVNSKETYSEQPLDRFSLPIRSTSQANLKFLEDFVIWLASWDQNSFDENMYGMSKQTHTALLHTTRGFISISNYLLNEHIFEYVPLGRFQAEQMEERYGKVGEWIYTKSEGVKVIF